MSSTSIWDRLRDEVVGQLVFKTRDEWGQIFVVDHGDTRALYFGAPCEQSRICREKPYQVIHEYARVMSLGLALVKPDNVLMLGLGGGSLLQALIRANPAAHPTVIEQREEVVIIARDFFQLPPLSEEQLIVGDARNYLRLIDAGSQDLIFSDLFFDDRMLKWQQQRKFLSLCHQILRPSGWLVINFDHVLEEGLPTMNALCAQFPTVLSWRTQEDNHVVLASPQHGFDATAWNDAVHRLQEQLEVPLLNLFSGLKHHPSR